MIEKHLKSRWLIFVAGMLIGIFVLVACASTPNTTTPSANENEANENTSNENVDEGTEPAEVDEATEPAEVDEATEPAQEVGGEGGTLAAVQDRGTLKCGIHGSLPGFGAIDADGNNTGFDVDFCRAVAAAVLGDSEAVEFIPLNADQRFPALQTGEIDVLIRNTTFTLTRDTDLGLDGTVTTFYDGQGYVVRSGEFETVDDLNGATVCVTSGTTTEANLADDFATRGLEYTPSVFAETPESFGTFVEGACDAYTSDKSQLASLVSASEDPSAYTILPDTISKEPLGPMVRANDSEWKDIISWVVYATIEAEELGIGQDNIDDFMEDDNIRVMRLLGTGEDNLGALLGLEQNWAEQVIRQVGNYGDIYARNIEPLGIERDGTLNALWIDGGLLYSPPFR